MSVRATAPSSTDAQLERAVRRAQRSGPCIVAVTQRLAATSDPSAIALRSRRPGEPWFCLEQPDLDRAAIATLGCAVEIEDRGPGRFERVSARWRELAARAVCDPPDGPPGSGLIACGGFAFAERGGSSPPWASFPAASLIVPEVAIARRGEDVRLTLAALVSAGDTVEELVERLAQRLSELDWAGTLPLLDPYPAARHRVAGAMAPEHYESAVARAVERIRAGDLEKVVLAREVDVHAPVAHDPAAIFGVLREAFGACMVFAVGRGEASFLAASPELLVRRQGQRVSTLALAGSARRSADPAVDAHLGEQLLQSAKDREEHAIVARRIARSLRPHAVWVTAAPEPSLVSVANIQHLATPVRAQLARPVSAVSLVGALHPTPAVGGEPREVAERLIPALEGLDRGWYSGPVGWTDTSEDGEFCVALRCALIEGRVARLYAGVGVVADSDPAQELEETELKLGALLPVLAG
ncbi:MAG: isochorismate synthase [Solirubrobacteraceae bacterium]